MSYIASIGLSLAVILAIIATFFAFKCFRLRRHVNISGIAVEATKDRSFLSVNFKLTLAIGAIVGLHRFFELWEI